MSPRLDPSRAVPDLMKAMGALEEVVHDSGLDPKLYELVKIRASQINGCGYCLHIHTRDARRLGESEERLHVLAAWRESSYFDEREGAALAWTEALTRVADTGAPDASFPALRAVFSEDECAKLTLLITTINAWNRIAIAFRMAHPRRWSAAA